LCRPAANSPSAPIKKPIAADKRARIIFADRGPIDTNWDPHLLSRGLIAHGAFSMFGAQVTPHLPLAREPRKGDTKLALAQAPVNWKNGDRLVLTGTVASGKNGRSEDEELTILGISGTEVTVGGWTSITPFRSPQVRRHRR